MEKQEIKKVDIMSADETAKTILDLLIEDLPFKNGDEVVALINGYGSTTLMEMYIISRKLNSYLPEKGISVYSTEIGEFWHLTGDGRCVNITCKTGW